MKHKAHQKEFGWKDEPFALTGEVIIETKPVEKQTQVQDETLFTIDQNGKDS